ncbi:TetR/AcrR family transcriptional regulator [Micromonospora endophytica]|uniref:TetR family transcriptional regulator n=1 Tax=Micromonospora endophytica TaxID=515350 RepID=A0A2W2DWW7_9ACTN|nr:TetR/AcrR family transcriptional regulator [Micromonospora endophytica]PZF97363.1 TetR family transcriptional regulator [Micromonospora endophytica]RIW42372.1 TetR family transcriptional regulator [Micromonospora endophytica]BCJ57035.1 TetR family transcriptional regulator [Micromonospora endophytica]
MSSEGLWSRTRRTAIAEITEVAMELFLAKGFEATTFDDIAAASGVSRRSVLRYFGTKEDIVLGRLADEGRRVRTVLAARPDDEPLWTALLNTMVTLSEEPGVDRERLLKVSEMMYGTPSLRARSVEKHLQWQTDLIPEVARRLGGGPDDDLTTLRATAVIAGAVACLDVAGETWTRRKGVVPLRDLLTAAFDSLRDAT